MNNRLIRRYTQAEMYEIHDIAPVVAEHHDDALIEIIRGLDEGDYHTPGTGIRPGRRDHRIGETPRRGVGPRVVGGGEVLPPACEYGTTAVRPDSRPDARRASPGACGDAEGGGRMTKTKKPEVLPPHWTYISFHAEDPGKTGWNRSVFLRWVILHGKPTQEELDRAWEAVKKADGRDLILDAVHQWPNNYKVDSRTAILAGRSSP
jgi:hypothetical protein